MSKVSVGISLDYDVILELRKRREKISTLINNLLILYLKSHSANQKKDDVETELKMVKDRMVVLQNEMDNIQLQELKSREEYKKQLEKQEVVEF